MSATPEFWEKWLPRAEELVRSSDSVEEACRKLSKEAKQEVSRHALLRAYKKYLHASPGEKLGSAPASLADKALEQKSAKRREQRLIETQKDLIGQLEEARARASFLEDISVPYVPKVIRWEKTSGLREGIAVALGSDWHIEEVVDPVSVAGKNAYNLEIAEKRVKKFFHYVRWLTEFYRNSHQIRTLVLGLIGDLISGYIHPELMETNETSPSGAVLLLLQWISDGLKHLLEDGKLEKIIVVCAHGNHGRTTEKRRIKTGADNSFEWLLYNVLRAQWANEKRIEWVISRSAHQYVEAYGKMLHFTHGDEVSYGGGVGGIAIPLLRRVPMWNSVVESAVHHVGHFHQRRDFGDVMVNGSIIGYGEYSLSVGGKFEPPQQHFYIFDAKRGKAAVAPIWVDEDHFVEQEPAKAKRR